MRRIIVTMMFIVLAITGPLLAQQTTGNISGRLVDAQGSAVPGVTVTAKNPQTGLTRTETSDAEGIYRLTALPVGVYDLTAELQGFGKVENKGIVVNVAQTLDLNMTLKVASLSETVTVTGESPLIETSSSSVGGVVDIRRIESLPLNGRQFANLAATIPGVGLGFHSDPTKSTQYAPQINGGAGRNVNYQIDGGDNNDDTVGGLLQAYPLEAIQEFNFVTQRFKAEYGRSNGGVMNIVTKSGTNNLTGSFFESFRDKSMNAKTETEKISNRDKQDYRRNQFGGSFGGPIARDRAHFFGAVERTQQDTTQTVNTKGLFPTLDGPAPVPYRETLVTGKATASLNASQYVSVRYGYNKNTQPYNVAGASATPDNWGDSINDFNSINLNHNWVLKGNRLNEFVFQYADFGNNIASRSSAPNETFPNGVRIGANVNTPQTTEQKKYQFRDDFSWHVSGLGGLGHDFKAGVNYINEPRLYLTFNTGKGAIFNTHLTDDPNGPIQTVTVSDGNSSANVPTKQFGTYVQDDWRLAPRLTLNLGLRYDVMDGYAFDQSKNPNFVAVAAAAKAGLLTGIKGLENMGLSSQNDKNNFQPRIGGAYDVRGNGKDVVRAGWGIYTDFGYSNSNVLFRCDRRIGQRLRAGIQRGPAPGHPKSRRQLLPGRAAALQHPEPEPGHCGCGPVSRTVGRSATPAALDPPNERRLVTRADAQYDRERRLRPLDRRGSELPAAHQPAHRRHEHPPARGAGANAQPERKHHARGGQSGAQRVQRPHPVRPPSPVPRTRLYCVLYAVEGREHDRRRCR